MAAFQWPGLNVRASNPTPGTYFNNGTQWSNVGFFGAMTGAGAENTGLATDHWPYDRIVHVPVLGDDYANTLGALAYQQDDIWKRDNGTGNWSIAHTTTNQSSAKDYGVHTGLYFMAGRDNQAYVCGIYAGSVATEVGAVIYDVENGTWSSFTQDVGGQFSACTIAYPFRGLLYLSTGGTIYVLNPATAEFTTFSGPRTDDRDKFFSLANRLFLTTKNSTNLEIYEIQGFSHSSVLGLSGGLGISAAGDYGVLQQPDAAYVIWQTLGTTGTHVCEITTSSYAPLSPITISDISTTVRPILASGPTDVDLVCYVAHDADSAPALSIQPRIYLMEVDGAGDPYSKVKAAYTWNGNSSPMSRTAVPGNNVQPNVSYTSALFGLADTLYYTDNKIVVYKMESAESVVAGGVRIYFWMFGSSSPLSIRLYYQDILSNTGAKVPLEPATLAAFSSGSYNSGQKRLDNLVNSNTGAAHNIVWDRVADVGSRQNTVGLNILMNSVGAMPVI